MNEKQQIDIGELYIEMYDQLLAYAASSLGNESLAEEAVQDTFKIACANKEKMSDSPNPRGWVIKVLKNVLRNTKRSRANANRLLMEYAANHGRENASTEDQRPLELTYGSIANREEFKLLREMAVDGRSHLEMAQARGISVDACKKRVQRAKEFLRKRI